MIVIDTTFKKRWTDIEIDIYMALPMGYTHPA